MSTTNDGGPAFPVNGPNGDHPGMSLREYFAAKAMQAYVSKLPVLADSTIPNQALPGIPEVSALVAHEIRTAVARVSYEYADAMLQRRAINGGE